MGVLGRLLGRGRPSPEASSLAERALQAPLPSGHPLLVGLASSLQLEHELKESGAVATWATLNLEARPREHLSLLGTDLETVSSWVEAVLAAVDAGAVRLPELRRQWGCSGDGVKKGSAVVGLAEVCVDRSGDGVTELACDNAGATDSDHDFFDGDSFDSMSDRSEHLGESDGFDACADGDGRYQDPIAMSG